MKRPLHVVIENRTNFQIIITHDERSYKVVETFEFWNPEEPGSDWIPKFDEALKKANFKCACYNNKYLFAARKWLKRHSEIHLESEWLPKLAYMLEDLHKIKWSKWNKYLAKEWKHNNENLKRNWAWIQCIEKLTGQKYELL